jgi:hypothetical protein
VKNRQLTAGDFQQWVAEGCSADYYGDDLVVRSWRGIDGLTMTSEQIAWLDGRVELLCFERLAEDVARFMISLNIAPRRLPRRNASNRRRPAVHYCDGETARALEDRYWRDFELWRRVERGEAWK